MSDKQSFPFWSEEWVKAQQTYWDTWSSMSGGGTIPGFGTPSKPDANPWMQMLEQWGAAFQANGNGADSADFIQRMLDQGKAFMFVGDQFTKFLKTCSEVRKTTDDWQNALRQQFEQFKSAYSPIGEVKDTMGSLPAFWNLPLDTWQRTVSGASLMPGDFLQSMKPVESVSDKLHGHMEKFLSVPGVGYTRESQEQVQQSSKLWLDYHRASQEYNAAHGRLGLDTVERLVERIIENTAKGEEISSLRQVYDIWIDCGEEAYLEFTSTDEYAEIYGRMVNALMALKRHGRAMVDETLGALGMPTRKGFDTIQRRQQELRREVQALKTNQDPDRLDQIERGLEKLQNEFAALQATLEAAVEASQGLTAAGGNLNAVSSPAETGARRAPAKKKTRSGKKKAVAKKKTSRRSTTGE